MFPYQTYFLLVSSKQITNVFKFDVMMLIKAKPSWQLSISDIYNINIGTTLTPFDVRRWNAVL
jgi:hypothetical protein